MPDLCLISDTHRLHRQLTLPPAGILIHCGDFCSFRQQDLATLEDVDDWFAGMQGTRVVGVGGNHDFELESGGFRFTNATLLQDQLVEIDGLSFYGSPWCPELHGFAYYAEPEMLIEKWRRIPAGIDVLITHTPPHGILDVPTSGDVHLGCPYLKEELKRIQPRLHCFGHVHANYGQVTEGSTRFINAAVVGGRNFGLRNKPVLVEMK